MTIRETPDFDQRELFYELQQELHEIDHKATEKYHNKQNNEIYTDIVTNIYHGSTSKANMLIDQCLAICGHSGFNVDIGFIRHQPVEVIKYLRLFI